MENKLTVATGLGQSVRKIAEVAQVRTLVDGGIRVVLDLPEDAVEVAAWLMLVKREQAVIMVEFSLE